ncbi:MAG: hypothetical protein MJ126_08905 [Lachnospiraceae bacterium]|nr:hypothetical protein [Lachnospiraceae bacterium]
MAEQFLTLMADLDDNSQAIMSGLYSELQKEGFDGVQTHGLPFHISLASYNTDKEKEVIEHIQNVTKDLSEIPVYISHIGVFPGGRVLFGAPDMSDELFDMHKKCLLNSEGNIEEFIWTPHSTFIIDEPERVGAALPILAKSFVPFYGKIVKLHLCAFWPTREILSIDLK